jgi:hypothetical protein
MNTNIEIQPQDLAMEKFRALFQAPLPVCHVFKDGRVMRYRIRNERLALEYHAMALRIIDQNSLPLEATIDNWKVGDVVFDRWLVLEYVAIKEVLSCY